MENLTPPPELVEEWCEQLFGCPDKPEIAAYELAHLAAQWGADQELEACCEWISKQDWTWTSAQLRAARRPKPPSLSRVALLQLDVLSADLGMNGAPVDLSQIRRALERLQELEGGN
jgi:hypothetical protein